MHSPSSFDWKELKKIKNPVLSNYHIAVAKYLTSPQCLLGAEREDYVIQMLHFLHLLMEKV